MQYPLSAELQKEAETAALVLLEAIQKGGTALAIDRVSISSSLFLALLPLSVLRHLPTMTEAY